MGELIMVGQERLKLHPNNIRLYYAPKDVEEMARSLAAVGSSQPTGNIQALVVTEAVEAPGCYYVVDGNLRLTAGRWLGEACPPFKIEVIEASRAEQLLLMAASGLNFPKDTISQGRHYRRLIEEEGYTQASIAEHTGLSATTISKCLAALELDEEIQRLFIEKKLPSDIRIIRALRDIPDKEQRIQIARYYAGRDVAIGRIVQRVRQLALRAQQVNGNGAGYREARARAVAKSQGATEARLNKARLRVGLDVESAQAIGEAAEKILCEGCSLTGLADKCAMCPGPMEFLAHLGEMVEAALPAAEVVPAGEEEHWHLKVKGIDEVREMMREFAA